VSEREPVRVPADVLEGLEAVRRHFGLTYSTSPSSDTLPTRGDEAPSACGYTDTRRHTAVVYSTASKPRARYTASLGE
jgi:hypothetical protein